MAWLVHLTCIIFGLSTTQAATYTHRYVGCYKDILGHSTLQDEHVTVNWNTVDSCVQYCGKRGYLYAGLQFSRECRCGNSGYDVYGVSRECIYPCAGNFSQICGGIYENSIYAVARDSEPDMTTFWGLIMTTPAPTLDLSTTSQSDKTTSFKPTSSSANPKLGAKKRDCDNGNNVGYYIAAASAVLVICTAIIVTAIIATHRRRQSSIKTETSIKPNPSAAVPNCYVEDEEYESVLPPSNVYCEINMTASAGTKDEHVYGSGPGILIPPDHAGEADIQSAYCLAQPISVEPVIYDNL